MAALTQARLWVVLLCMFLSSCASLQPGFETPEVELLGVRPSASGDAIDLRLRIVNHNRQAIQCRGLSYRVAIDGRQLVSGVSNDIPLIEGFAETEVDLRAQLSLIGGMGLIIDILRAPKSAVSYRLDAKLDIEGLLLPLRIEREGDIDLGQL